MAETGRSSRLIFVVMMSLPFFRAEAVSTSTVRRSEGKPPVLAHYYTWYTTAFGKHGRWGHWRSDGKSTYYPDGNDPDRIVFPPSIRQINSSAYPLIGPYDSDNRDVVRWHIRLAKAAGIDGFLVDWWGEAGWQKPKGLTRHAFEQAVMPVAEEERFKVCFFDETPQFHGNLDETISWAARFLKKYKNSPAYLKIDGQPVYSVYQLWDGRLTPQQGRRFIREVEAQVGDVYWIFDRIVAVGEDGKGPALKLRQGWGDVKEIDAFSLYATFSTIREYHPDKLTKLYSRVAEDVHRLGKRIMLPVHPGLDNRKIQTDEVAAKAGEPHWIIPRANGKTLRGFLRAAGAANADFISITSWNEWPETTNVEPALTWPDPYLYLKIIAKHQGVSWRPPPLPPESALDPAIRPSIRSLRSQGED